MASNNKGQKVCMTNNICEIYDFNLDHNFSAYLTSVKTDFKMIKSFFPLLILTILPTAKPKEVFITGTLIPYEILKKCKSDSDIDSYSIYIRATYPSNFNEANIYVEDVYSKINWSNVPEEHRHLRFYRGKEILCTHHLYGEINGIPRSEQSLAILFSAWKLYIQYREFQKSNEWILPDLPHGVEAIKELKKMGCYYGF